MILDVEDLKVEIDQIFQEEGLELSAMLDYHYLGKDQDWLKVASNVSASFVFETNLGFELVIYHHCEGDFSIHTVGSHCQALYWPLGDHLSGLSGYWSDNNDTTTIGFEELKRMIKGDRMCLRSLGVLSNVCN